MKRLISKYFRVADFANSENSFTRGATVSLPSRVGQGNLDLVIGQVCC